MFYEGAKKDHRISLQDILALGGVHLSVKPRVSQGGRACRLTLVIVFLMLEAVFCSESAFAATYYLDAVNGDDANPGTSTQPWKTLNRAYTWYSGSGTKVAEGDTVLFRNGNYGEFKEHTNDGSQYLFYRTNWITYKADTGHSPTLSSITIFNSDKWGSPRRNGSSYLKFVGFNITNCVTLLYTSYIHIEGCNITQEPSLLQGPYAPYFVPGPYGIGAMNAHHLTIQGNEISNCYRGISVTDSSSYITIKDNLIHGLGEDGAVIAADNVLVENNTIYNLSAYHVPINIYGGGPTIGNFTSMEVIIQDVTGATGVLYNVNERTGYDIVSAWLTSSNNFESVYYDLQTSDNLNRTLTLKGAYGNQTTRLAAGQTIYLTDTHIGNDKEYNITGSVYSGGCTIVSVSESFNEGSTGNYGRLHHGYRIVGQTSGAVIRSLTQVDGEHGDALTIGRGGDNYLVTKNRLLRNIGGGDDGQVLKTDSPTNLTISNNLMIGVRCLLVEGTENFNLINNTMYGTTAQAAIRLYTTNNALRNTVINNMFNNIIGGMNQDADNAVTARIINHGNNIFGSNPNGAGGPSYPFTVNSTELVNYNIDSLFVNKDGNNYDLAGGSIAINFGDPAYAPETDISGNLRDNNPDAGCYEYIKKDEKTRDANTRDDNDEGREQRRSRMKSF